MRLLKYCEYALPFFPQFRSSLSQMNARIAILRLSLALGLVSALLSSGASAQETGPHLLLTPRRLHRLKLDRQRQTDRWMNSSSALRARLILLSAGSTCPLLCGYEEERAGRDAIAWAMAHSSELEQRLLVADWCTPLLSATDRETLASTGRPTNRAGSCSAARNFFSSRWCGARTQVLILRRHGTSRAIP